MTYATTDELAAALKLTRVTPEIETVLQKCLDAAGEEIDKAIDWVTAPTQPIELPPDPLLNRVNVLRGVEWWKANDAAFGIVGFDQVGAVRAPRDSFSRHRATLIGLKEQWGIA